MKIVAGFLLLIAGACAYPVAESDVKTSELPLVITDYASVAKAEDQLPLSAPHGKAGHVHDSEESASAESAEIEKPQDDKKEEKSVESSEERVMKDDTSSAALPPIEDKQKVKEDSEELQKPQQPALSTETRKEIKSEPLNKMEAPKLQNIDDEKKDATPALKSLPVEDVARVHEKLEIKDEVALGKSAVTVKDIQEKKSENQAPTEAEKPLALPTLRNDLPAESVRAEEVVPSEQKVEASPVAEEVLPQLKSTELLEKKPEPSTTEKIIERKETVLEKVEEKAEKPETNKVDQIKEVEKKPEVIKEEIKEQIKPAEGPQGKTASILQAKPELKNTVDLPGIIPEDMSAKKALPESEQKKDQQKILAETPNAAASVPESKPIEPPVEKVQEKAKEDEKLSNEEPKATAKSIEESKPEEKKSEEVSTEKLPTTSASSS